MMIKVITQCEFKNAAGQCTAPGRNNVVSDSDDCPPILTPMMALRNYKGHKFIIAPVPDWQLLPKNLPPYIVFSVAPTDALYRAWVPDNFKGGTISSFSTIEEIYLRFYPGRTIKEVPLVPESLLLQVFNEARVGRFSSEMNKELAGKFNILGFGEADDYARGLESRCNPV